MRAVVAPRHGGPDVLVVADIPAPPMVPGGVRVAVAAASVNFPDVLTIAGRYQVATEPPFVPGCEFCGRVIEVAPDVTTVEPGQMVFGLGVSGAFAEETVVDAAQLTRVSDDVDPIAAAAFGVVYLTGYHALRTIAQVEPDDWVVVLGAGGGVGLATVELAHVMGAKVLACASGAEKLEAARAKGADAILDYSREDLKEGIKAITGGGADVVVDPVGGPYSEPAVRATRWGGRFVVAGFASGEIPRIPLNLLLLKGVIMTGFENRTIAKEIPEVAAQHRRELFEMFENGTVVPHVSAVYALQDTREAIEVVAERRVIGKVVIDLTAD